jgi:hypothetical protein
MITSNTAQSIVADEPFYWMALGAGEIRYGWSPPGSILTELPLIKPFKSLMELRDALIERGVPPPLKDPASLPSPKG